MKIGYEEMTEEKMVNVVIAKVDPQKKVEWLKTLNGHQNFFPRRPINGPTLNPCLNRRTFGGMYIFPCICIFIYFYSTCQYA